MLKSVGNALSERRNLRTNFQRLANIPVIYCWIASHLRTHKSFLLFMILQFEHGLGSWFVPVVSVGEGPLNWKINLHSSLITWLANCYSASAGISAGLLTSGFGSLGLHMRLFGLPHSMLASEYMI